MHLTAKISSSEELSLASTHRNYDPVARAQLIESYLSYAIRVGNRFSRRALDDDARVGIVSEALINAIDTYNPLRCASMKTHVTNCIKRKLIDQFRRKKNRKETVSFDAILPGTDEDGNFLTLHDIIPSPCKSPEEIFIKKETHREIQSLLHTLQPVREQVLSLRYGQNKTQRETAQILGYSKTWVANQEHIALDYCRKNMSAFR